MKLPAYTTSIPVERTRSKIGRVLTKGGRRYRKFCRTRASKLSLSSFYHDCHRSFDEGGEERMR